MPAEQGDRSSLDREQLLRTILSSDKELPAIADELGIDLVQIIDWARQDGETDVVVLTRLALLHTQLNMAKTHVEAITTLLHLTRKDDPKALETARKACVDLLRVDAVTRRPAVRAARSTPRKADVPSAEGFHAMLESCATELDEKDRERARRRDRALRQHARATDRAAPRPEPARSAPARPSATGKQPAPRARDPAPRRTRNTLTSVPPPTVPRFGA